MSTVFNTFTGIHAAAVTVDYTRPVTDVFKDFVESSMRRAHPTRALDILCRPWARTVMESQDMATNDNKPIERSR